MAFHVWGSQCKILCSALPCERLLPACLHRLCCQVPSWMIAGLNKMNLTKDDVMPKHLQTGCGFGGVPAFSSSTNSNIEPSVLPRGREIIQSQSIVRRVESTINQNHLQEKAHQEEPKFAPDHLQRLEIYVPIILHSLMTSTLSQLVYQCSAGLRNEM